MTVCPKCGLPTELCVCQTIAKETQKIRVYMVQKKFRKSITVIKGIDTSKIDIKDLIKKLKSKLACGGTYKNGEIELQGDHRQRVKDLLVKEGFDRDMVEVS